MSLRINILALIVGLSSLALCIVFPGCASKPWYQSNPYYCVEWGYLEPNMGLIYGIKIQEKEIPGWQEYGRKGMCGKITGPYPALK